MFQSPKRSCASCWKQLSAAPASSPRASRMSLSPGAHRAWRAGSGLRGFASFSPLQPEFSGKGLECRDQPGGGAHMQAVGVIDHHLAAQPAVVGNGAVSVVACAALAGSIPCFGAQGQAPRRLPRPASGLRQRHHRRQSALDQRAG